MTRTIRLILVFGGYAVAAIVAFAIIFVRQLVTSGANTQASAGMFAFGDAILFALVFGALALLPTLYALYLLRDQRWVWLVLATIAGIFAIATIIAASAVFFGSDSPATALMILVAAVPAGFILLMVAAIAPTKRTRGVIGGSAILALAAVAACLLQAVSQMFFER